jgi:coenzyme F420-0:L-glutamate ligase/coenzyme F420-1:gamma-L-glutamate ligase
VDYRGQPDTYGRPLKATLLGAADALAAVAGIVMGKTARTPAAVIRGFLWDETDSTVTALLRPAERDLFL